MGQQRWLEQHLLKTGKAETSDTNELFAHKRAGDEGKAAAWGLSGLGSVVAHRLPALWLSLHIELR